MVLLIGLIGWWSYKTFIWEAPPVPGPSSTERTIVSSAETWPTSGGNLAGTRSTSASAQLEGEAAWSSALGVAPATAMIADGERLYVTLNNNMIVALAQQDGTVAWVHELAVVPFAAPTLAGDRLYVPMRSGQLLSLDAATGDEVFASLTTGTRFGTSPLVDDGVVYVFGVGALFGFDAETGDLLWRTEIDSPWGFVNPVLDDNFVATVTGNRSLVFDRVTGLESYFYEFERANPYAVALVEGDVYTFSSRFGTAYEVESRRPWWEGVRAVWEQFWIWGMAPDVPLRPAIWVGSDPPRDGYPAAVTDDLLLLGGPSGDLVAISRADGSEVWRIARAPIVGPPLATADGLLVVHVDRVATYDFATGTLLMERLFEGPRLHDVVVTSGGTFIVNVDGETSVYR
ncbi:MAG: PQQ-binding-like beta-propeller repeat protein [Dehalococcoidia bacterium]|nr:PQQ-binding-like beta-propeller repeat protein [Dehalococcoidia bacterium]